MQFGEWILVEAERRGWSLNQLAKKAGTSSGGLSMIVNGLRKPGPDVCLRIARALGVNPVEVFQLAGLLPPEPDVSPVMRQAIYLFTRLSDEMQEAILAQMEGLVEWEARGAPKMADAVRATAPGYIVGRREE